MTLARISFHWILKDFAKITGKHLCQNLFFNKVADVRPATFKKNNSGAGVSCKLCPQTVTITLSIGENNNSRLKKIMFEI